MGGDDDDDEDEELDAEDQEKMILEQFDMIYKTDAQLREVLGNETSSLSLEEKYQILQAYMHGGGVKGLLAEGEDEDDLGKDGELDPEEVKMIEDQFNEIYTADAELRKVLAGSDPKTLNIKEKYQILYAYKQGGGVQGLLGEEGAGGEDDESVIVHKGKKFRRVQIEGEAHDYLMDEEGNIYDTEF